MSPKYSTRLNHANAVALLLPQPLPRSGLTSMATAITLAVVVVATFITIFITLRAVEDQLEPVSIITIFRRSSRLIKPGYRTTWLTALNLLSLKNKFYVDDRQIREGVYYLKHYI